MDPNTAQVGGGFKKCFPDAVIEHLRGAGKEEMRIPDIEMASALNSMYPDVTFRIKLLDSSEFYLHNNTQTFNASGPIARENRGINRHNANIERMLENPGKGPQHSTLGRQASFEVALNGQTYSLSQA